MLVFARVVQAGSFTTAATELGMPKSTVSREVSELAERLKSRLLQRTTRKSLTDVGRTYYEYCARDTTALRQGATSPRWRRPCLFRHRRRLAPAQAAIRHAPATVLEESVNHHPLGPQTTSATNRRPPPNRPVASSPRHGQMSPESRNCRLAGDNPDGRKTM